MNGRGYLAVSIASVMLAACGSLVSGTPTPTPPLDGAVALPTVDWGVIPSGVATACAGVGLVDAHLMGDRNDPRVTWLVNVGKRTEIVWPAGFHARFTPQLEVIDASGRVVMRGGDRVEGACVTGDPNVLLLDWP